MGSMDLLDFIFKRQGRKLGRSCHKELKKERFVLVDSKMSLFRGDGRVFLSLLVATCKRGSFWLAAECCDGDKAWRGVDSVDRELFSCPRSEEEKESDATSVQRSADTETCRSDPIRGGSAWLWLDTWRRFLSF